MFTVCLRESSFTALQQGDINDLLRVSFPVQINRVIIKLASDLFSSLKIADKNGIFEPPEPLLERCVYRPLFACYVFRAQRSPCLGSSRFRCKYCFSRSRTDPNCSSKYTARQRQALTGPPNTCLIIAASISQRYTKSPLRTHASSL